MNNKTLARVIAAVVIVGVISAGVFAGTKSDETMSDANMTDKMTTGGDSKPSTMVESNQVIYKNFDITQPSITVKKGTTVTWTNEDSAKHDVTPVTETEEFKASKLFGKGETYSVTFNTVGSFDYYCSPHPYMKGTVEVTE